MTTTTAPGDETTTGPAVAMLVRLEHDLRVYRPRSRMSIADGAIERILYMVRNSDEISAAAFEGQGAAVSPYDSRG